MAIPISNLEQKIKNLLEGFRQELSGIRGNRPTPKLVEDIKVDYSGQKLSIKQLGSISISLPSTIEINIWDKTAISGTVKAIESSNMGFSVSVDGGNIRVILPPLSEERRIEITKIINKEAEKTKIHLRALRDECNKTISNQFNDKEISEDEKFKSKEKVQEMTNKTNKEIENIAENKIKEIYA